MTDAPLVTVRNAARLLKAYLARDEELGVTELARRLGLGKSTVHRLVTTLVAEGLLEQDPDTGGYRLGMVVFELGEAVRGRLDLHTAAGPVLVRLRERTGESSQVGVVDGEDVVYVLRIDNLDPLRPFAESARRAPLHGSGAGKVLLAFGRAVSRPGGLRRLTPQTITDPDRLRDELALVRARGWAVSVDEGEVGVASLAAPVRDHSGAVVAAIGVHAPTPRFRSMPRGRLAAAVIEAGDTLSRRLGWSPDEAGIRPRW